MDDIKAFKNVNITTALVCLPLLKMVDITIVNGNQWILDSRVAYDPSGKYTIAKTVRKLGVNPSCLNSFNSGISNC